MLYLDWDKIKVAQKNLGITDQELADKAHTPRQNIVNWRHRKAIPSSDEVLQKICETLGLSVDELIIKPKMIQKDLFTELLAGMLALTKLENTITNNETAINSVVDKKKYKELMLNLVNTRQEISQIYMALEKEKDNMYIISLTKK